MRRGRAIPRIAPGPKCAVVKLSGLLAGGQALSKIRRFSALPYKGDLEDVVEHRFVGGLPTLERLFGRFLPASQGFIGIRLPAIEDAFVKMRRNQQEMGEEDNQVQHEG